MTRSIEQRLTRLEDIEAIKQLKYRYFNACDRKDSEVMRDCMADGEIHIDYGALGTFNHRDKMIDLFLSLASGDHIIDLHHGQNPEITIESGTTARAVWALYFFQINTETQQLTQLGGHYEDTYIKQGGVWRMNSTIYSVHSSYIATTVDIEDAKQVKALFAGCRPDFIQ